jgi:hypothetical protein
MMLSEGSTLVTIPLKYENFGYKEVKLLGHVSDQGQSQYLKSRNLTPKKMCS